MRNVGKWQVVRLFLVVAFLTAGISPACKFISGQAHTLEICTPDGLRTISLPTGETPAQKQKDSPHAGKDCAFCFAAHVGKAAPPPALYAAAHIRTQSNAPARHGDTHPRGHARAAYQPRGPPVVS